jgi:hypothetical protein
VLHCWFGVRDFYDEVRVLYGELGHGVKDQSLGADNARTALYEERTDIRTKLSAVRIIVEHSIANNKTLKNTRLTRRTPCHSIDNDCHLLQAWCYPAIRYARQRRGRGVLSVL